MAAKNTDTIKRATPRKGEPKFKTSESVEDNVYRMRNAGLTWRRVEELCGLKPFGPAQRAYKAACEARGEQPRDWRKKAEPKAAARKKASK